MHLYSYQLYSSRKFLFSADDNTSDWAQTFAMISAAGYSQVEGLAALYEKPEQTLQALQANNLSMPTGHFSLDMLEKEPARVLEVAETLGIESVYCPFLLPDLRPTDSAGYTALGERLQAAGQSCMDAGLAFGWHNHDFEFIALPDGKIPMQCIFDGGPKLGWEADIAWVVRGGANPVEWIERYGERITSVHVKDIAATGECTDEDGWADVGHGTVDWASLMPLLRQTGAKYYIVEHDNPSDDKRFAQRSYEYLVSLN